LGKPYDRWSCSVLALDEGGRSGVTEQTLIRQLNLERDAELLPSTLITKVKRLIGLVPNSRWECLAVQLQTPSPSDPQQLEQVWKLVRSHV
jgi:hypothetical protein